MAMILAYTVSMTGVRRKLRHSLGFLLRVDGGEFWYTPDGPPARYAQGQWQFENGPWLTIRMESPVLLQFVREQECPIRHGPFCPVFLFDGHLYCGTDKTPLAAFDAEGLRWRESATGETWTGLVFMDASV